MPSAAEYMHIGDTTTRLARVIPRSVSGVNIGGGGASVGATATSSKVWKAFETASTAGAKLSSRWRTPALLYQRMPATKPVAW